MPRLAGMKPQAQGPAGSAETPLHPFWPVVYSQVPMRCLPIQQAHPHLCVSSTPVCLCLCPYLPSCSSSTSADGLSSYCQGRTRERHLPPQPRYFEGLLRRWRHCPSRLGDDVTIPLLTTLQLGMSPDPTLFDPHTQHNLQLMFLHLPQSSRAAQKGCLAHL